MTINKDYLKQENIVKIMGIFKRDSSVQLHDFFTLECYSQMKSMNNKLKFKKSYLATSHSYSECSMIIMSKELNDFVSKVTGKKAHLKLKTLQFSWKDYLIINDKIKEKPGIDIIFDLTDNWDENSGGSIVYVDGSGEYTRIPPKGNTLLIAERKKGVQKFIQYVNHLAKNKKRYLIVASF